MRRLVLFIEIAFIILIISVIYRRYIKPFRQAMRSARERVNERPQQGGPQGRPVDEPSRRSSINSNPHKPIDKSNVQDAEFEDLS